MTSHVWHVPPDLQGLSQRLVVTRVWKWEEVGLRLLVFHFQVGGCWWRAEAAAFWAGRAWDRCVSSVRARAPRARRQPAPGTCTSTCTERTAPSFVQRNSRRAGLGEDSPQCHQHLVAATPGYLLLRTALFIERRRDLSSLFFQLGDDETSTKRF